MKKIIIIIAVSFIIAAAAIILAVHILIPNKVPSPVESIDPLTNEAADPVTSSTSSDGSNPFKSYDNGIATFTYDSRKVYFDEMPSETDDGIPQTWFFMTDSNSAMPSVAVFPLTLESPFNSSITDADWEELAKAYIMSFFSPDVQGLVTIDMSGTVVKIEGESAKMYVAFDCDVASSPQNNMNGCVRLVSDAAHAVVTVAVANDGQSIPEALTDTYMSAVLS